MRSFCLDSLEHQDLYLVHTQGYPYFCRFFAGSRYQPEKDRGAHYHILVIVIGKGHSYSLARVFIGVRDFRLKPSSLLHKQVY